MSINLGALLCIECSGPHRGLGVHISKIRSLHLDDLENETLILLLNLGNNVVNEIYEKMMPKCIDTNQSDISIVSNSRKSTIPQKATPKCDK